MVQEKTCSDLNIDVEGWHGLGPLHEIIDEDNDVFMDGT